MVNAESLSVTNGGEVQISNADVAVNVLGTGIEGATPGDGTIAIANSNLAVARQSHAKRLSVEGTSSTLSVVGDGATLTLDALTPQNATNEAHASLQVNGDVTITGAATSDDAKFDAENLDVTLNTNSNLSFGDGTSNATGTIGKLDVRSCATHTVTGPSTDAKSKFKYGELVMQAGSIVNLLNTHAEIDRLTATGGRMLIDPAYVSLYTGEDSTTISFDAAVGSGAVLNIGGAKLDGSMGDLADVADFMSFTPKNDGNDCRRATHCVESL